MANIEGMGDRIRQIANRSLSGVVETQQKAQEWLQGKVRESRHVDLKQLSALFKEIRQSPPKGAERRAKSRDLFAQVRLLPLKGALIAADKSKQLAAFLGGALSRSIATSPKAKIFQVAQRAAGALGRLNFKAGLAVQGATAFVARNVTVVRAKLQDYLPKLRQATVVSLQKALSVGKDKLETLSRVGPLPIRVALAGRSALQKLAQSFQSKETSLEDRMLKAPAVGPSEASIIDQVAQDAVAAIKDLAPNSQLEEKPDLDQLFQTIMKELDVTPQLRTGPQVDPQVVQELKDTIAVIQPGQKLALADGSLEVTKRRRAGSSSKTADALIGLVSAAMHTDSALSAQDLGPATANDPALSKALAKGWWNFCNGPEARELIAKMGAEAPTAQDVARFRDFMSAALALGPRAHRAALKAVEQQLDIAPADLKERLLSPHRVDADPSFRSASIEIEDGTKKSYLPGKSGPVELPNSDYLQRGVDEIESTLTKACEQAKAFAEKHKEHPQLGELAAAQGKFAAAVQAVLTHWTTATEGAEKDGREPPQLVGLTELLHSPEMKQMMETIASYTERQPRFAEEAKDLSSSVLEAAGISAMDLQSLIIAPVQTGPRIPLLMKEPSDVSKAFKGLVEGSPLGAWAQFINENQRANDLLGIQP